MKKKLLFMPFLHLIALNCMELSDDNFLTALAARVDSRTPHEIAFQDFVEEGSPDDLDPSLMSLSLDCAPRCLHETLKGFKISPSLFPRVWTFLGAPGTGKSTAALAVARELGWNFVKIEAGLLANEYQNAGAQNIWRTALPALRMEKSRVIIFDEVDALTHHHNQEKTEGRNTAISLQKLIDRVTEDGKDLLIFTCNTTKMHQALRSRIAKGLVEFDLPSPTTRIHIINSLNSAALEKTSVEFRKDAEMNYFIERSEGLSIRDLEGVFEFSAQKALFNEGKEVKMITRSNIDEAFARWKHVAEDVLALGEEQVTEQERLHKETLEVQVKHYEESLAQQKKLHEESLARHKELHIESLAEHRKLQEQSEKLQRELAAQREALQLIQASKSKPKDAVPSMMRALTAMGTPQAQATLAIAGYSGSKTIVSATKAERWVAYQNAQNARIAQKQAAYLQHKAAKKTAKQQHKAAKYAAKHAKYAAKQQSKAAKRAAKGK